MTPLPEGLKRFDWDTRVRDILPKELNWSLAPIDGDDSATRNAKIKDILGHVSGLPPNDFTYWPGDTAESLTRRMGKLRTAYELREQYSYNNQVRIVCSLWGACVILTPKIVSVLHPRSVPHRALRQQHVRRVRLRTHLQPARHVFQHIHPLRRRGLGEAHAIMAQGRQAGAVLVR